MKSLVHLLVFDGFADWEPALACAEINKAPRFEVRTVGFSGETVRSMAGLRIVPDLPLQTLSAADSTLLIVPGGDMWEDVEDERVSALLRRFSSADVPIALICGATIAGARAGLLNGRLHTSNFDGYLERHSHGYRGKSFYRHTPAITDQKIVSASGMGSVEFAYEIIRMLGIYNSADLALWLAVYQQKVVPDDLQG
jgi:putative intracellular protease/amidase